MSALKQVYLDSNYPHISLPSAEINPLPSSLQLNQPRRGRSFINQHFKNHLFLSSSTRPTEMDQKISAIESTVNDPEAVSPYMQILKNIDSMERSINRRIQDLQEMGSDRYLQREMQKAASDSSGNAVENPENHTVESSGVLAVKEVKNPPPLKRKKSVALPINIHEEGFSKKKRAKKM